MLKRLTALALVLLLMAGMISGHAATKKRAYIIPDSDTRLLTAEELWQWDYESIGFIMNEIFARHGYNFIPGGKYDNFFSTRPWYTPNDNPDNSAACYPKLSSVEWANERLCKDVRAEMRLQGTTNRGGMNYMDYIEVGEIDVLSGFELMKLKSGQKLPVYSAPSESSWRGAKGKASVSTNGSVYGAGWVDGWLLVMYETNNGAVRVGYVHDIKGTVEAPYLSLSRVEMALEEDCALTDDPATSGTAVRNLRAGDNVIYLSSFYNVRGSWAYVETTVDGKQARGFIPVSALGIVYEDEEEY